MAATESIRHKAKRDAAYRNTLWSRANRLPTIGLVFAITLFAFEFMGIATALPTIVSHLHGGRFYAWPFAAANAAAAVGTVAGGRVGDRHGPALPLVVAIALFGGGLVIGGTATSMAALLVGRVVQGFGTGAALTAVYLVVALVYPERDRPAASAALSAAWVVPALVGPPIAGLVTQQFGWRWVFFGLLPLLAVVILILLPVLRKLPAHQPTTTPPPRRGLLLAAVGAAIGVSMFTFGAQQLNLMSVPLLVGGLVLLAVALRRLLPRGTLRSAAGLPALVLSRGLLGGAFAGVEAFIPLALTTVHGYTPATAGLPLTGAALGWAAASAWQGRHPDLPRGRLLAAGFGLVAAGNTMVSLVDWSWAPGWLALVAWPITGAGMGLGVPSIAVLLLNLSPSAERGFNTSAMQLADTIGTVLFVGIGGVLLNALGSTAQPTLPLFIFGLLTSAMAVFGAVMPARRAGRATTLNT